MLDEPTNHLDMHSCDLLIDSLKKYEGSLILVSHDRYFISKTANKIWEIVDREIKEFKGGYEEWVAWKERMAKQAAAAKAESTGEKAQGTRNKDTSSAKASAGEQGTRDKNQANKKQQAPVVEAKKNVPVSNVPINKDVKKELQRLQKQFQQLEEKLAKLNQQKADTEAALNDPQTYADKNKFQQTETAYAKITNELAQANAEYEKVFEKIVELEGN
jgi:ATP-binding cassette, subfamily F, member 3